MPDTAATVAGARPPALPLVFRLDPLPAGMPPPGYVAIEPRHHRIFGSTRLAVRPDHNCTTCHGRGMGGRIVPGEPMPTIIMCACVVRRAERFLDEDHRQQSASALLSTLKAPLEAPVAVVAPPLARPAGERVASLQVMVAAARSAVEVATQAGDTDVADVTERLRRAREQLDGAGAHRAGCMATAEEKRTEARALLTEAQLLDEQALLLLRDQIEPYAACVADLMRKMDAAHKRRTSRLHKPAHDLAKLEGRLARALLRAKVGR
jgi:hypothetical protein